MGMNYYLQTNACSTCGNVSERIHIGKKSMGWPFLFQAHKFTDKPSITSYQDIQHYIVNLSYMIVNEDSDILTLDELKDVIDSGHDIPKERYYKSDNDMNNYIDKDGYRWHTGDFS